MGQKDNFGSGFVLGSVVGGVVGGILGTLLATRNEAVTRKNSLERQSAQFTSEESMEVARHSLEDKIAQLNLAIDEVRQQLGSVNSNSVERDRLN